MTRKYLLYVGYLLCVPLSFALAPPIFGQPTSSPDLARTQESFTSKIKNYGKFEYDIDKERRYRHEVRSVDFSNCKTVIKTLREFTWIGEGVEGRNEVVNYTFEFTLADIDPQSVKVVPFSKARISDAVPTGDPPTLFFETTSGDKVKVAVDGKLEGAPGGPKTRSDTFNRNYFSAPFSDESQAKRAAAALKHAVELCGGKADPF